MGNNNSSNNNNSENMLYDENFEIRLDVIVLESLEKQNILEATTWKYKLFPFPSIPLTLSDTSS